MAAAGIMPIRCKTKILVNVRNVNGSLGPLGKLMKQNNEQKITTVGAARDEYVPVRIGNSKNYVLAKEDELRFLIASDNRSYVGNAPVITDTDEDLGRLWDYDGLWESRDGKPRLKLDSGTRVDFRGDGRISTISNIRLCGLNSNPGLFNLLLKMVEQEVVSAPPQMLPIRYGTKILVDLRGVRDEKLGSLGKLMKQNNEQKITTVGAARDGYIPLRIGNDRHYVLAKEGELRSLIANDRSYVGKAPVTTDTDYNIGRLWDYDGLWESRDGKPRLKLDSSIFVTVNKDGKVSTLHKEPTNRPSYELRGVKGEYQIFPDLVTANRRIKLPSRFGNDLGTFNFLLTMIKPEKNIDIKEAATSNNASSLAAILSAGAA